MWNLMFRGPGLDLLQLLNSPVHLLFQLLRTTMVTFSQEIVGIELHNLQPLAVGEHNKCQSVCQG